MEKTSGRFKKRKGDADLILFTQWDRFSRNIASAYKMIGILRKIGVQFQAIEQPLDMEIPKDKIMLTFYLDGLEVEKDKQSLNVSFGMRRAKKEGRYMGTAPLGYINKTDENGTKYIAIRREEASILKLAFEELSLGLLNNVFKSKSYLQSNEVKQLKAQIEENNRNLSRARDLLLNGNVDADNYRLIESFFIRLLMRHYEK